MFTHLSDLSEIFNLLDILNFLKKKKKRKEKVLTLITALPRTVEWLTLSLLLNQPKLNLLDFSESRSSCANWNVLLEFYAQSSSLHL
jgi:hypothetical protein